MKKEEKGKEISPKRGNIKDLKAFKLPEEMINPCKLTSRLDQAVTITYGGQGLIIPPRANGKHAIIVPDKSKLGGLPNGISIVKY